MQDAGKYIVWVVPVFFLMIALEIWAAKVKQGRAYRMNDSVTNLQIGLGEQIFSIAIKGLLLVFYAFLWKRFALFSIEFNVLNTIVLLILFDFLYYWAHRLSHEINFMWATHIVHHSSQEYNLTVALRQPWFQPITTAWLFLPLAFLGFPVEMFVLVSAIDILYQFWIHTEYIPKMGKVIEFVLNTPSHHRVHHGIDTKYLDKNHGGIFIIWDRLFGTFKEEEERPEYGITTGLETYNPIRINTHYFEDLWKRTKSLKGINKLKVWFKGPAWNPETVQGSSAPPALYNPPLASFENLRLGWAFLSLSFPALYFIWFQSQFPLESIIFVTLFLIGHMSLVGLQFEQRAWALKLEPFRLVALFVFVLWMGNMQVDFLIVGMLIAIIISLLFFFLRRKYVSLTPH